MAKSNRKLKEQARNKREARKFWQYVAISTLILLILLYILFSRMS